MTHRAKIEARVARVGATGVVDAEARERYRKDARRLYALCLANLAVVRSTYRHPERDYKYALSRAHVQRAQLKQTLPPATGFPSTLFPPG